jgi:hypothetical protein
VLDGLDLAVDALGRLPPAVDREQEVERNAEERLVFLEAGLDECPIVRAEGGERAAWGSSPRRCASACVRWRRIRV